jgi:hypothetical protein
MKAFTGILIVVAWISPLNAQDTTNATKVTAGDSAATRETRPYRNPAKPDSWGLIPGRVTYTPEYARRGEAGTVRG